ncbi:MAG TPA: aminopeptidase N [Steroidobacteraceae bacterium]|nr:aminopeptidase N [Steroidobacteraceae bacterium]
MSNSNDRAALAPPRETRLVDYRPPAFLVDAVELDFDLDPHVTRVRSRLALRRNPAAAADKALHLDGAGQPIRAISLDGLPLGADRWRLGEASLFIADAPDVCVLEIETVIDPAANTELSGLYISNGAFFTQCEAEGFRRITYFPDRPDVMARYTVSITADAAACPVMLSNGNPGPVQKLPDGRHRVTWTDPHPKPCYLFALVAGQLVAVRDRFTTRSGREVALAIWVRPGDEDRCGHAMRSLKAAMRWDEERFGLEYDLDVYNIAAVSDFNMGAMENKGLNVFNTACVLANPQTATDADYQSIESVIGHEYFHNWTGNRVTCRDWFQLSLKEGLTVYRDQEFSMDQGSRAVKRIADVRLLRAAQFREDAGPLAHPVQPDRYQAIDNFYTATVYNKGAEVIRMMATIIGRDAFRRGMDLYFARHDNQAVTIDDFVAAMADASGVDLTRFKRWYHQAGTPELTISDEYDAAARRYALTVAQRTPPTPGQPEKQPLVVPLAMSLLQADGSELPLRLAGEPAARSGTRVLLAEERETRFVFEDVPGPPVPSLLRGFSAPVRLSGLSAERLHFLATYDSDPFVRWDAGQRYATDALLAMAESWRRGEPMLLDPGVIAAAAATLAAAQADPAFAAKALALPGEGYLADQQKIVDTEALHAAREAARAAIGRALREQLRAAYDRLADPGPYRVDGEAIGRRALRNACLAYMAAAGGPQSLRLAKAQFDRAANMTDVLAALAVLSEVACPERAEALEAFHARWRGDALVLDKWFAIQAISALPDTLQEVRRLAAHPDFDLRNPNRVRALMGSFCSGNQVRFHTASGAGYDFLADMILALDPLNPQVAARLIAPLGQWRRMDAGRQEKMRAALQRIADAPRLSRNTGEMAGRSLAQ